MINNGWIKYVEGRIALREKEREEIRGNPHYVTEVNELNEVLTELRLLLKHLKDDEAKKKKQETIIFTPKKTIEEALNVKLLEDVIGVDLLTGKVVRKGEKKDASQR